MVAVTNSIIGRPDLVIVDEAHTVREVVTKYVTESNIPTIGLSATPLTKGLGKVYTHLVNAATTNFLLENLNPRTEMTYLAPLKIYSCKPIDMTQAL